MHYYSANEYYKELFGCKVYKIALNLGTTCPTRDGTKDRRGCIFCSNAGSGDFAFSDLERAKSLVSKKNKIWGKKVFSLFSIFYKHLWKNSRRREKTCRKIQSCFGR